MTPLLAMFGALLIGDAATYDLAARTEIRGTSPAAGTPTNVNAREMQLDVSGDTTFALGAWTLTAGYQPRILLFLPDESGVNGVTAMNNVRLGAELRLSATQTLRASESASYGTQDYSPLNANAPGTTPQQQILNYNPRLPLIEILASVSTVTQLAYQQKLSPELTTSARASYSVAGGADESARSLIPFQHGLSGDASLGWQADRHDSFGVTISGTGSNFVDGSRSRVTTASLSWSALTAKESTFAIALGGGLAHSADNSQATGWQPAVTSSVSYASVLSEGPQRISYSLRAGASTMVDPQGDGLFVLGDARLALNLDLTRALRISATAGGGRGLTGASQAGSSVAQLELFSAIHLAPSVDLAIGARSAWVELPAGAIGESGTQWAGYAALTIADRGHF